MLLLNNTFRGGGWEVGGVGERGGGDEYSETVSGEIAVNCLFFLPLRLLGCVGPASGPNGPSCTAHLLGSRCEG